MNKKGKEMDDQKEYARVNSYRKLNGIELVSVDQDACEAKMEIEQKHINAGGYVHGGALFTIADCVGGTTARTDGRQYVTQSAHINFIKNIQKGTVIAKGKILSRGRKIAIVKVMIYNEEGMLLANVICDMYCVE